MDGEPWVTGYRTVRGRGEPVAGDRAGADALFRTVLDAAPDGIAVVDGDGGTVLVNAGSISSHAAGTAPTSRGETSLSPLRTAGGPLVTAIIRDVTERKLAPAREQHARREAEESVALLETILSAAPVGLAFVDTDLPVRPRERRHGGDERAPALGAHGPDAVRAASRPRSRDRVVGAAGARDEPTPAPR